MDAPSTADPPFAVAPDIQLDLPVPPSVNRTRRINWAAMPQVRHWTQAANALTLSQWSKGRRPKALLSRFEAHIILSEKLTRVDLDNILKKLIDYARGLGLIVDDCPQYMRRVVVEWGEAPEGVRLILRGVA